MKAHIVWIGMIDTIDTPQTVPFETGVNVVTGRSSTGKSALIEVFDYCFGSSDYTVPVGVITKNAKLFFVVIRLKSSLLVLARGPDSDNCFLYEDFDLTLSDRTDWMTMGYFQRSLFRPLEEYKKALRPFFGIRVTDVDEDVAARDLRGGRKLPTPSVRSLTSFMLQHQNLIANKHAIFYRFDEKQKREQAIDHLKVFLGFANQEYFMLKQKENDLEQQRRQLQRALPRIADRRKVFSERVVLAKKWLEGMSGQTLEFDVEMALDDPAAMLSDLRSRKITFSAESDIYVRQIHEAQLDKTHATAQLRQAQVLLSEVNSSKNYAKQYEEFQRSTQAPALVHLQNGECPLCHVGSLSAEPEANALGAAIDWLNGELSKTGMRSLAFEEEEQRAAKELDKARHRVAEVAARLDGLYKQVNDLQKVRSQYERTVEARVRLEGILEDWLRNKSEVSDLDLEEISKQLRSVRAELGSRFNMQEKLDGAEARITELMAIYGARFDFEKSYHPIQLRLSLDTFDLWHDAGDDRKVFLRAMGSGANWLASHLVLFLSLQRYFCELGDDCSIPPILFLDQPSQVYFPAVLDGGDDFDAHELAERDATRDKKRNVDEDLLAVTNLFDQLVWHCDETERETSIRPQIIITDHADHIKLKKGSFDTLVRARWRHPDQGFVYLPAAKIE